MCHRVTRVKQKHDVIFAIVSRHPIPFASPDSPLNQGLWQTTSQSHRRHRACARMCDRSTVSSHPTNKIEPTLEAKDIATGCVIFFLFYRRTPIPMLYTFGGKRWKSWLFKLLRTPYGISGLPPTPLRQTAVSPAPRKVAFLLQRQAASRSPWRSHCQRRVVSADRRTSNMS